jgi:hypothetical protein
MCAPLLLGVKPTADSPSTMAEAVLSLLMIKFDKSNKTVSSDFLFRTFWFRFHSKAKEKTKFEDLKIQCVSK